MLKNADHQHAGIVLENIFGAVTVVYVEVHHRNTLETVFFKRMSRRDRHIVEKTESHRLAGLGVMAGRADGAKGVFGLPRHHEVGGKNACAGGAQCCLHRVGANGGVGVEVADTVFRHAGEQFLDVLAGVSAANLIYGRHRCIVEREIHVEACGNQTVIDCREPFGRFRMVLAHVVKPAITVRDECGTRHKIPYPLAIRCYSASFFAWPGERLNRRGLHTSGTRPTKPTPHMLL